MGQINKQQVYKLVNYDNPVIFPLLSISIPSDAGIVGSPGIRIISPGIGITNPAPAANSNSITVEKLNSSTPESV